ncbi:ComF family protein [Candidatus Soleaferrea massiliensis]|uniref:ComF family protein n=1 Tax=Candidatus Soleaferrea massiliensis TaxID=1470354 RepID=UPI000694088E|nr:ComF family protein [Candidatus Soleaferrea massiliensis]
MRQNPASKLLAVFFPPRCVFCRAIIPSGESVCGWCQKKTVEPPPHFPMKDCFALYAYQKPVSDALKSFKTREQPAMARAFGGMMAARLSRTSATGPFDLATEVPMTLRDQRRRGFNQSQLLAKSVARALHIRHGCVLHKLRQTAPQHTLGRFERMRNVAGAFAVRKPEQVRGKRILLIDDIVTTGSTLRACRKALLEAGAELVVCMTAAASLPERYDP